ncbi:MAG: DUF6174 domain-containing protein [Gemmatimonadota bacterium]|nr:DUF6174 domain-containing protein [Gemmatimonadota bacterium]
MPFSGSSHFLLPLAALLAASACDALGPERRELERDAHSISATYDPETGVPIDFFIDYEENVDDEELGMRVTEPVTTLNGA